MELQTGDQQIAVILTCHNRKEKTLACLISLYKCALPQNYILSVFLVDDGSTDGTSELVYQRFPLLNIIQGDGNLFWAGGMRLAWNTSLQKEKYDAFLMLNDDVVLEYHCLINLIDTHIHSLRENGKSGIYVGSTTKNNKQEVSYGGHLITKNHIIMRSKMVVPNSFPQVCHFANANILWICKEVVHQIGTFDTKFTHGIADYDYTLTAYEHNIPLWVAPEIGGYCPDDHGNNWLSSKVSLNKRIEYLKSPKGLAYHEYLYYVRKHFPLFYPYSFVMLWLKTFFPAIWEKIK